MTTNDGQYVPSDEDVRSVWVVHERDCGWEPHPGDPSAEFDRFLARVRRDAARSALDGLRESHAQAASILAADSQARFYEEKILLRIDRYRATHYPEQED